MKRQEFDQVLEALRRQAQATRIEWETKNPVWMPGWVELFEKIDLSMQNYGDLPGDWSHHYSAYL